MSNKESEDSNDPSPRRHHVLTAAVNHHPDIPQAVVRYAPDIEGVNCHTNYLKDHLNVTTPKGIMDDSLSDMNEEEKAKVCFPIGSL